MPELTYTRELVVEWGDCDPAGIVFFPRYFEMFDVNTNALMEAATGLRKAELLKHYNIASTPLVNLQAKFHLPSRYGDTVRISSAVVEFRRSSFDIEHRLMRGDQLGVEGRETRVWAGQHPDDPQRLKAVPIPTDLVAKFG